MFPSSSEYAQAAHFQKHTSQYVAVLRSFEFTFLTGMVSEPKFAGRTPRAVEEKAMPLAPSAEILINDLLELSMNFDFVNSCSCSISQPNNFVVKLDGNDSCEADKYQFEL